MDGKFWEIQLHTTSHGKDCVVHVAIDLNKIGIDCIWSQAHAHPCGAKYTRAELARKIGVSFSSAFQDAAQLV